MKHKQISEEIFNKVKNRAARPSPSEQSLNIIDSIMDKDVTLNADIHKDTITLPPQR